jgi:hypothetical protein
MRDAPETRGAFAGSISLSGIANAVSRGYATAATDDGNSGPPSGAPALIGNRDVLLDYGYRGMRRTPLQDVVAGPLAEQDSAATRLNSPADEEGTTRRRGQIRVQRPVPQAGVTVFRVDLLPDQGTVRAAFRSCSVRLPNVFQLGPQFYRSALYRSLS